MPGSPGLCRMECKEVTSNVFGQGVKSVLHVVRSVYPVGERYLILEFDGGEYRVADIRPFLVGPVFEPLKDRAFFRQVKVDPETGTVTWPNEADLDPDVLYAKSVPLVLPEEAFA